jgi:hypothetical protein
MQVNNGSEEAERLETSRIIVAIFMAIVFFHFSAISVSAAQSEYVCKNNPNMPYVACVCVVIFLISSCYASWKVYFMNREPLPVLVSDKFPF